MSASTTSSPATPASPPPTPASPNTTTTTTTTTGQKKTTTHKAAAAAAKKKTAPLEPLHSFIVRQLIFRHMQFFIAQPFYRLWFTRFSATHKKSLYKSFLDLPTETATVGAHARAMRFTISKLLWSRLRTPMQERLFFGNRLLTRLVLNALRTPYVIQNVLAVANSRKNFPVVPARDMLGTWALVTLDSFASIFFYSKFFDPLLKPACNNLPIGGAAKKKITDLVEMVSQHAFTYVTRAAVTRFIVERIVRDNAEYSPLDALLQPIDYGDLALFLMEVAGRELLLRESMWKLTSVVMRKIL